ncbi:hypothetical protein [Pseudomonas synxantha]|nr:hypothetical protein [Pseudomonas synxantha]
MGRGLAPDCGVSVILSVADPLLSGASPLPHFNLHTTGKYPTYLLNPRAPDAFPEQEIRAHALGPAANGSAVWSSSAY